MKKIFLVGVMILWSIFAIAGNMQNQIEKVVCLDWMGQSNGDGEWTFYASSEVTSRAMEGEPIEHCHYILVIQKDKTKVGYAVSGDIITLDKKNRLTQIVYKDTGMVCNTMHETFDIFRKETTECSDGNKNVLYYTDGLVVENKQYKNNSLVKDVRVGVLQCQETNRKTLEATYYDCNYGIPDAVPVGRPWKLEELPPLPFKKVKDIFTKKK